MNFNQADIELLEAYQSGQLSAAEADKVKERLSKDKEFQALFDELKSYQNGLRHIGRNALRAELQDLEKTLPPIEHDGAVTFFKPNMLFRAAAGITIIFGLGILLLFFNDKPADINSYLTPYPNIVYPVERSNQLDTEDDRQLAYQAYDREQYALAVERFTELTSLTYEDHFYIGLSLMLEEKYDLAVQSLHQVIDSPNELNIPARWYAGLCYMKLEKPEEAAKVLQPLIDQKTSYADMVNGIIN